MRGRRYHYKEAQKFLEWADRPTNNPEGSEAMVRMAQAHATLAAAVGLPLRDEEVDNGPVVPNHGE